MKISNLLLFLLFSTIATAQNLTISSEGETGSSGTNWSISGNVLNVAASGSASINTSVITNHLLNTGDLTINLPWQSTVGRNININNTIAYSGSSARTLTFQSANDIVFTNAVGITSTTASLNVVLRSTMGLSLGAPDNGLVKMDGINIDTKGGHFWVGGGTSSTTWNGLTVGNTAAHSWLDDVPGISVVGSTIASGGGDIYMAAQSWNSTDDDGVNYGLNVQNTNISSGEGDINLFADLYGRYTNGIGLYVHGTTSITSTTGPIYIRGYGADQTTNGNSWRHAASIQGSAQIKSVSGAITVIGDAAFTATVNDKEGLNITDGAAICSQTGNITLRGTNTLESSGQFSNSIRFSAANLANSILIGYDGTNAYSGNISIEGNSIYQRSTQAGSGSIAVQTTGTLTIQPTGNAFTYMRAGDAGTLTFDNDWNFGTTLGGFVYGKSTNTTALTYSNALTTSGPITMYAGTLTQNGAVSSGGAITFNSTDFNLGIGTNISTSTASDITFNSTGNFLSADGTRRTISSANGNIKIHADKDAVNGGVISIDYLTFNPGTGATIIRGETVSFFTGSVNGPYINGTGAFTFQSSDASFGSSINTSWFEIDQDSNGIGAITIGKVGSTADIYQDRAISTSGPVNMYGNTIAISAALTATNSDLSLYANTAVTQSSAIIAAGLSLNGTGTFTLTNTSNNFTTLAGGAVGTLLGATQVIDVSGGLTIGTVGSTTGLTGSSTIRVETLAGNLTFAGSISTTSTSTDAVILTAAKSTAIGVPTGGDILVSGSPTINMGAGGIAKLYSGYDMTSTGLTTLAGGASNVRINYDETTTTFNPVLSASNKYAIYRTAFGYGDLNIVSSGGDAEGTTWTYSNGVITPTSGTANVLNTVVQTKLNATNLSIEANKVTFSANVTGTTSNTFSILSKTHIVNTNATTITTQGGNVLLASNVDDATDNETTVNGYILFGSGLTITTNGGNITLGGGNVTGTDYALGTSAYPYEGIRIDGTLNFNSSGGNITMKGKSYAISTSSGAWGVGFWNLSTGSISSGTGAITLDGFSQSSGGSLNSGLYSFGALTITSENTTADAIQMIGKAIGNGGQSWSLEADGALSLLATGTGGGITVSSSQQNSGDNYDVVFRGETNILAKSGPINLLGGQSGGIDNGAMFFSSNLFLGSKASSAVPTSSSNITIQYDMYVFNNIPAKLATSGTLNWKPVSASFGQNVFTSWFDWNQNSQTLSGLTIGKSGNTANVYLNNAITVAGPISVYGNYVEFTGNITSSATGDIFIKSLGNGNNPSVYIGAVTINKSAGTGTLTFQASGRVLNYGTLSATGTGLLNVVMWSDYDNTNQRGGVSQFGTISTNGGHVWLGGSNAASGSYTWNGLTVGDGPSIGSTNYNCNALDLFGPITTGGGDVLLWASNASPGCGTNGIVSDGTRLINAGSGDITLIAFQTLNPIDLTSTGVISLVPHAGSYASALSLGGTLTSGNFTFNTSFYNGLKINSLANAGLVIGNYSGHLSGSTAVTQGNTSTVTASSALSTKSLEIYGGSVIASAALTAAGNIIFDGDNGSFLSQNTKGVEINAAVTTTNNGNITINGRGGSATVVNTFGINVTNLVEAGGTGNIELVGYGGLSFDNSSGSSSHGVNIEGASAWVKSNGGNVAITGYGGGAGVGAYSQGVPLLTNAKVSAAGSGTISITGTGGVNTAIGLRGVVITSGSSVYSAGGAILITGTNGTNGSDNSDGVTLDTATIGSSTSGPITIVGTAGGGTGSDAISLSNTNTLGDAIHSNNVLLRGDKFAVSGTTSLLTTGKATIEPYSNSFSSALTFPISSLSIANTITGLTLGKATNTANITFNSNTTVAGPITAYGGTITLDANLSTTNNGAISLYSDNALGGLNTARTLTAAGAFKFIPRGTTFTDHVTYPITNLTATSTGLTIGNTTNTKNITINQDVTGGAGIELFGANVNINSNLKTTSGGAMYLKGITTIAAGKYIESNGAFTHDGNMTFKSNASGTAAFGTLGGTYTTVSGTSTVERYIPAKRAYRFLSSSVTTTTTINQNWQENGGTTAGLGTHITGLNGITNGFDDTTTNNPSMFTYTNGSWSAVTNTSSNTISAGTAYRLMVRGDRTISLATNAPTATVTTLRATGVLKTGSHSPTLNQATDGYSFVGNPYQAPVDIKAVLATSTNMNTGVVYYWDPTLNTRGAYVTRTLSSVSTNAPSSDFTEILQPGQAVFVKNAVTGTPSMTFNESNKSITSGAAGVFRATTTTNDYGLLRVNLKANANNQWTTIEGALAVFSPMYSWEVTQEDANKFSNLDEEVSFMLNNTSLAIACQSDPSPTNELPMKLNNTRYTNYQWQFELGNYSGPTPYLFDTQNNTYTPIENNTIVPFAVNGQELTRFKIVFQNGTLSITDFSSQVVLYPNPGASGATSFNIEGISDAQVTLFTLLGQNIPVKTATNGKGIEVISKTSLNKGVYLVCVTKEGKTSHVKWIVE